MFERLAQAAGWSGQASHRRVQVPERPVSTSCHPPQRASIHFDTHQHMGIWPERDSVRIWNAGIWIALLWSIACRDPSTVRGPSAVQRDVILITIDTLRADR